MEVNGDVLQAALARAITDSVSLEVQKEIFQRALTQHLFHASSRPGEESVLSQAFKRALDDAVRDIARATVNLSENKKRIEEAVQKALDAALADSRFIETLQNKIARSCGGY